MCGEYVAFCQIALAIYCDCYHRNVFVFADCRMNITLGLTQVIHLTTNFVVKICFHVCIIVLSMRIVTVERIAEW